MADQQTTNPTVGDLHHRKVFANGVMLHCVMAGDGPPLLLVHGWLGSSYTWRKVIAALSQRFTVIAPDMRGYGDSQKAHVGYDGMTLKDDLRALVAALGLQKVAVVGHDMGALPALLYAAHHPDEVQWLGYLDEPIVGLNDQKFTAFTKDNPFVYWWFAFNATDRIAAMLWEGKEVEMIDHMITSMVADPRSVTAEDKREYLRGLRSPGGLDASFGWYREALVTGAQIVAATSGKPLELPVLALNGEYGHPGVREQFDGLATTVDGGVIKDCGHLVPEEQPQALVDWILAFDDAHGRRLS